MKYTTHPVIFRCDGSSENGIGHLTRCLSIADELRSEHGITAGFALRSDESGAQFLARSGYPVYRPKSDVQFDYNSWLSELVNQTQPKALILDVRDDLSPSTLMHPCLSQLLLVDIDDPCEKRLYVDLAFYPPVPQVDQMDWSGFQGRLYKGWDWIPLRGDISNTPPADRSGPLERLLVTAGGADPAGMSLKIVQYLASVKKSFETVVVAGPAFQHLNQLEQLVSTTSGDFRIVRDPESLPALMAGSDLAITAFGVTAYELAALGVPAVYLCLTPDHQESASSLAFKGIGVTLGLFSSLQESEFIRALMPLLESSDLRERIGKTARSTVDGNGAKRISKLIVQHLESK